MEGPFKSWEEYLKPETRRWPVSFSCFLAGSMVLHAILVAMVLYVPAAQDILHIASIFSGLQYTDEEYQRIKLQGDVTLIRLSPSGKFEYPPGYFLASRQRTIVTAPQAQPTPSVRKVIKPAATPSPKASPDAEASPSPSPQIAINGSSQLQPQVKTEDELNQKAANADVKLFPKINVKPFRDQLAKAKALKEKGELDVSGTIEMTIEADRNDDGSLKNVKIVSGTATNEKLKEVAEEFVQALSASHALVALEGADHLRLTVKSDQERVALKAVTAVGSSERARDMARIYGAALIFERIKKSGKAEEDILKNTTVGANGNLVTVNFEMSRNAAGDMLNKELSAQ